jgi:N-acetylmuramoyl-L-alanine amidase
MTFTADTPIIGWEPISAAQIDGWIAQRGQAMAAQFAPDRTYRPAPAHLGELAIAAAQFYPDAPVNPYLLVAQIDVESAAWQSALARNKNNPTGYGAEDDDPYNKATTFPTPWEALFNTANHLRVYALGYGPWFENDLRATKIPARNRGNVKTVRQLSGTYATDPTYHTKVVARMNLLLAFEGGPDIVAGAIPKPPMRTDIRSKNYGHNYAENGGRVIEAICDHIGEGSSASNLAYLSTGPVSSNYFVHENGTIYELVPPQYSAWTNGDMKAPNLANPLIAKWARMGWNPNVRTVTIEHGGYSKWGAGGMLTSAQWTSTTWLQAWLAQEYRLPIDRTHVIGHFEINSIDKQGCPGFSTAEWDKLLQGMRLYGATYPTDSIDENAYQDQVTKFWIVNDHGQPMLSFWQKGGVPLYGHPLEGMHLDQDGVYRQLFENVLIESYPDGWAGRPGPFVRLGGLGQRYQAALQDLKEVSG